MKHITFAFFLWALLSLGCTAKNNPEPVIRFKTTAGVFEVKLYAETPQHRDNFVKLVASGYYDGQLFHRVIADFMVQAGDPSSKNASQNQALGSSDTGYKIAAEIVFPKYFHKKGALAAARQPDSVNPEKESSGGQFYIVKGKTFTDEEINNLENRKNIRFTDEQRNYYKTLGGAPHLDSEYTVFGEVIKGMEVIVKISTAKTGQLDRPLENIRILKAKRIK
jgi:cyclophilin family peptidyl-prolyl cis-trans isomerase